MSLSEIVTDGKAPPEEALVRVAGVLLSVEDSLDDQLVRLILPASTESGVVDSKCDASVSAQLRMRLLRSEFDILRMNVTSADDDNIFYPAGHEQLTVVNESEIAGSQKEAFLIVDPRIKAIKESRVLIVVTACNTLASNPDLADCI